MLSTNLQIFPYCSYRTCNITEGNTTIPALATVLSTSDHNTTNNTINTTQLPTAVQNLSRLPTGDDIGDVVCSPPPSYLPPDVRILYQYIWYPLLRIRYPGSGSGMNIPDNFFRELRNIFLGLQIHIFFDADRYPGSGIFLTLDPGSGMEKLGSGINIPGPQHCWYRLNFFEISQCVILCEQLVR